jgi:hypothetical protein
LGDFILFTHTKWSEAPRIRHQVANLLLEAGHRVFFFERPSPFWRSPGPAFEQVRPGLTLVRTRNLLHHQLRALVPMHWLNAAFVESQIRRRLAACDARADATVINFAHDYYFLRRLFPKSRIVTIIHDDFEAQSRLPFTGHIAWSLERTCRMSDEVFAVSTPLQERLRAWCDPKLLLPWSVVPYRAPSPEMSRRRLLVYWGFVDSAIDLDVVRRLSDHLRERRPDWRILLVGPTQGSGRQAVLDGVAGRANIEVRGRTELDELPLDEIAAALAPYRSSPACDSVTLANKSMQLFARGLPLLISNMPAYIQQPFIVRLDGPGGVGAAVDAAAANFLAWQPQIERFVADNAPATRLALLGIEPAARAANAAPAAHAGPSAPPVQSEAR